MFCGGSQVRVQAVSVRIKMVLLENAHLLGLGLSG